MSEAAAAAASTAGRRAEEARLQARVDRALQEGWAIRWDPDRLEYRASRELHTARTLDALLDAIGAAR